MEPRTLTQFLNFLQEDLAIPAADVHTTRLAPSRTNSWFVTHDSVAVWAGNIKPVRSDF